MVIIFEGVDRAGKKSISTELHNRTNGKYVYMTGPATNAAIRKSLGEESEIDVDTMRDVSYTVNNKDGCCVVHLFAESETIIDRLTYCGDEVDYSVSKTQNILWKEVDNLYNENKVIHIDTTEITVQEGATIVQNFIDKLEKIQQENKNKTIEPPQQKYSQWHNELLNCDYRKHSRFTHFNKRLITANLLSKQPTGGKVLELCAGDSNLEEMLSQNFNRPDLHFTKVDNDERYKGKAGYYVGDVGQEKTFEDLHEFDFVYDAVILIDAIEHIQNDNNSLADLFLNISRILRKDGLFIVTGCTPPHNKYLEKIIFPQNHKYELGDEELTLKLNARFKVVKKIGLSLEEREYNEIMEYSDNKYLQDIYFRLRGAMPESYIRALIAMLARVTECREILYVCRKR